MDSTVRRLRRALRPAGQPASRGPHGRLTLNNRGAVKDVRVEEHYTCVRCKAVFARILAGEPHKQIWMLLNASQH